MEAEADLRDKIEAICLEFSRYGYRRVTHELRYRGCHVNHKKVLRIMRESDLLCRVRRRRVKTTNSRHRFPRYPNLIKGMVISRLNQVWLSDITYIRIRTGFVYLAAILDAETIECIVYNGSNGKELQLIENINRKDMNYMELAGAYRSYLDSGHTLDELSQVVGKPKNIISWMLNLEKCRPEVQHLVRRSQLSLVIAISLSKLTENGQLRALRTMQTTTLNVAECQALCEQIYSEENQVEMFTEEPKLTEEELKARAKIQSALDKACQALQEVNKMEVDNPGISAQAIAEKLDITQEKVDLLYKLVGQFKKNLRQKRVAALC